MSAAWQSGELLAPISPEEPCGQNLEDTALLNSFDGYGLYGRSSPWSLDDDLRTTLKDRSEVPPDWGEIKEKSLAALRQSKDLRLLAPLAAALLQTDGLPAFLAALRVASGWLETYWDQTYPRLDGDGLIRRSALNCFADPIAVVDRLRRVPLVTSRQHGMFSLRDFDLATGQISAAAKSPPDEIQISAAFAEQPLEELTGLVEAVSGAEAGLRAVDERMRAELGPDAAPEFDPLFSQLGKIERILRAQLAARPEMRSADGTGIPSEGGRAGVAFSGSIASREEAVRALEAVSAYFRLHEPSSPVPLLCDRAKRLVSKGFLDLLADLAPDGVRQARAAGGLKDEVPGEEGA